MQVITWDSHYNVQNTNFIDKIYFGNLYKISTKYRQNILWKFIKSSYMKYLYAISFNEFYSMCKFVHWVLWLTEIVMQEDSWSLKETVTLKA